MSPAANTGDGEVTVRTGHSPSHSGALIAKFNGGIFHHATFRRVNLSVQSSIACQLNIASDRRGASFECRRGAGEENSKAHSDAGGLGENRVLSHLFQTFCYILEGAIASLGRLRKILTTNFIGTVSRIAIIYLIILIGIIRTNYQADSADLAGG